MTLTVPNIIKKWWFSKMERDNAWKYRCY
jgi:hypothetical protein